MAEVSEVPLEQPMELRVTENCRSDAITRPRANVLGIPVDAVNMERALALIAEWLESGRKGYVCALGVHGIMEALRSPAVGNAVRGAAIALPDGTPTVWVGRAQGHRGMDHVTGPAIMRAIFGRPDFAGYSHFLYGGKPGVAGELARSLSSQFSSAKIVGTYTPPFRELTYAEECKLTAEIDRLGPDIVWVGISTPRQELFMQRMLPRLNVRMMFGVGAAYDLLTGRIQDCPPWVKRVGMQWLHRLAQDPRRLWRRNLHNSAFLWYIALQLTGLRDYGRQVAEASKPIPLSYPSWTALPKQEDGN